MWKSWKWIVLIDSPWLIKGLDYVIHQSRLAAIFLIICVIETPENAKNPVFGCLIDEIKKLNHSTGHMMSLNAEMLEASPLVESLSLYVVPVNTHEICSFLFFSNCFLFLSIERAITNNLRRRKEQFSYILSGFNAPRFHPADNPIDIAFELRHLQFMWMFAANLCVCACVR